MTRRVKARRVDACDDATLDSVDDEHAALLEFANVVLPRTACSYPAQLCFDALMMMMIDVADHVDLAAEAVDENRCGKG